jgi:hypothetical protein
LIKNFVGLDVQSDIPRSKKRYYADNCEVK